MIKQTKGGCRKSKPCEEADALSAGMQNYENKGKMHKTVLTNSLKGTASETVKVSSIR